MACRPSQRRPHRHTEPAAGGVKGRRRRKCKQAGEEEAEFCASMLVEALPCFLCGEETSNKMARSKYQASNRACLGAFPLTFHLEKHKRPPSPTKTGSFSLGFSEKAGFSLHYKHEAARYSYLQKPGIGGENSP